MHQAKYKMNLNYTSIVKQDIDKLLVIGFIQVDVSSVYNWTSYKPKWTYFSNFVYSSKSYNFNSAPFCILVLRGQWCSTIIEEGRGGWTWKEETQVVE
jgi:hypothetical protein